MQLKHYQQEALDALRAFLQRTRVLRNAQSAFTEVTRALSLGRYTTDYQPLKEMPEVPYACIRIPTGGGKTILGAHVVKLAGRSFLERDYPVALWLVPSKIIRQQTVEALKDPTHPYRRVLDDAFEGRVRVFDIADFRQVRPTDMRDGACVVVATIQTLRVQDTEGRKVYAHDENLEPHFSSRDLPEGLERDERGQVKFSFANLLHLHHPLVIVDEAHNAVTGLTHEMQTRLNPACIVEFTATPDPQSNVLFSVSASVLKDEDMIKLPIQLTAHTGWQGAVNAALKERAGLAKEAEKAAVYLRPLVLFQAQDKDQEVTAAVLRQHLIDNEQIAPEKIAVATGDQRELDGVDLFDPKCPIECIITVQALKEGWDCSFAYVFCSVANIRSATAVEQLLGRVLRMPHAMRNPEEALNQAYAHVCEPNFVEAAVQLRDRLVDMGFETEEADENIRLPALPLTGGAGAPPSLPVVEFALTDKAAVARLPAPILEAIQVVEKSGQTMIRVTRPLDATQAEAVVALALPAARDDITKELDYQRAWAQREAAPSSKGERFVVPQLCYGKQGALQLAEPDLFLHLGGWKVLDYPAALTETEFSPDQGYQKFQLDIDRDREAGRDTIVYGNTSNTVRDQLELAGLDARWDDKVLIKWLDRECRMPDVRQQELLEFVRRAVQDLLGRGIPLSALVYSKYRLAEAIRHKIAGYRQQAGSKNYQDALFASDAPVEATFKHGFEFMPDRYPARWFYVGAYQFKRHFYPRVGELENGREEFECARALDMLPQVKYWVRNLVTSDASSFRLPLAHGWFYPDFVALLNDGRIAIMEYKGAHLKDNPAEKEKANIGALWEAKSGGKGLFIVVEKTKAGRDMAAQMSARL